LLLERAKGIFLSKGRGCGVLQISASDSNVTGIGRALLAAIENGARALGALTIYLGADDHNGSTSLGQKELFPNVLDHVKRIKNSGLCLTCRMDDAGGEEQMLCLLNRNDQRDKADFECGAYEPK
jgi:hypothetical protein